MTTKQTLKYGTVVTDCKIIVTNGDVKLKLIDKTQDTLFVKRIFFGESAYGSLKTKKISTES